MENSSFFEEDKSESMEEAGLKLVVKKKKTVTFALDFSDKYLENKSNVLELRKQVKIENKLDYYLALYPLGCPAIPPHLAECELEILNQLEKDISMITNNEIKRRFWYAYQTIKLSFMAASALGRKIYGR